MNFPAAHNLKPFDAVRPAATGVDLAARPLRPVVAGELGRHATETTGQHEQLVDQTRTWVAQTFFGTLLKQMRDSPFKSDIFSGGQGGQAFSSLHDQHLAEHMARGAGSKLVNSIVRRIEANAAYSKHAVTGPGKSDNRTPDGRNGSPREMRSDAAPARRA